MSRGQPVEVSLPDGEVWGGPWRSVPLSGFATSLPRPAAAAGRPTVVAVDGRSASGKTTLAARLVAVLPDATLVHTDDVAWWHGFFDWADLMRTGVLEPLRRGSGVRFVPPAWIAHADEPGGRPVTWPDGIVVPPSARAVVVEGVGATRRELADLVDVAIWVQADEEARAAREAARVAAGEVTSDFVDGWQREELPFLADQRPWDRADHVVASTPGRLTAGIRPTHLDDVLVGAPPRARAERWPP